MYSIIVYNKKTGIPDYFRYFTDYKAARKLFNEKDSENEDALFFKGRKVLKYSRYYVETYQ